jgi:hypothetical protein
MNSCIPSITNYSKSLARAILTLTIDLAFQEASLARSLLEKNMNITLPATERLDFLLSQLLSALQRIYTSSSAVALLKQVFTEGCHMLVDSLKLMSGTKRDSKLKMLQTLLAALVSMCPTLLSDIGTESLIGIPFFFLAFNLPVQTSQQITNWTEIVLKNYVEATKQTDHPLSSTLLRRAEEYSIDQITKLQKQVTLPKHLAVELATRSPALYELLTKPK